MPRQKTKHLIPPVLMFKSLAILWLIGQGLALVGRIPGSSFKLAADMLLSLLGLALVASGLIYLLRQRARGRARQSLTEKTASIVDEHIGTLIRYRAQLLTEDDYGTVSTDRWYKEIDYFISRCVIPSLGERELQAMNGRTVNVIAVIDHRVAAASVANPAFFSFSNQFTPTEFESYCAQELRRGGWKARVTQGSHDQGVDVVAEKNGIRLAIQCKLYSRPVGNKAVQEIVAGKLHEGAQYGAVVSNSQYTADARRIAVTTGTLLLHYSDLAEIEKLLEGALRKRETNPPVALPS